MRSQDVTITDHVILFVDVHNYSLAGHTPADSLAFLQEMYETLGDVVVAHEGEIVKYLGDSMLCVFPAGAEGEAVRCAGEMRRAFATLVGRWGLPRDVELEVGIASGEVAVGVVGHLSLRHRDVFGGAVDQAATIGHHRGIAVTEPVHHRIQATHETRRLPDRIVKWRDEPLKVWEVVELGLS